MSKNSVLDLPAWAQESSKSDKSVQKWSFLGYSLLRESGESGDSCDSGHSGSKSDSSRTWDAQVLGCAKVVPKVTKVQESRKVTKWSFLPESRKVTKWSFLPALGSSSDVQARSGLEQ